MLFEIDQTIADLFVQGSAQEQDYQALRYLALGSAEGSHRITGQRKVLQALAGLELGDRRLSRAFERAKSRVALEGGLSLQLRTIAKAVANDGAVLTSSTVAGRRTITVPLRWFDSSSKIQPTLLLAENLDDVRVARICGRVGPLITSRTFLPLSLTEVHGGGNSIGSVLKAIATQHKFCLCLADSDKPSPASQIGQTAQGVASFADEVGFPLLKVITTQGRDLENALPDFFYYEEYSRHSRYAQLSVLLRELSKAGEYEVRRHLDIEKGFTLFEVLGVQPGSAEQLFWSEKAPTVMKLLNSNEESFPCINSNACLVGNRHGCTCLIVQGNGTNVLRDFLGRYENIEPWELSSRIEPSVSPEWQSIGEAVLSWCCGDSPIRL